MNGEVLFDDIHFERHPYDAWAAYSQSKTAKILFTVEAARRWAGAGVSVNAINPGRISSTGRASAEEWSATPSTRKRQHACGRSPSACSPPPPDRRRRRQRQRQRLSRLGGIGPRHVAAGHRRITEQPPIALEAAGTG
ncbi:SDR family NAD(P)-dependent oxidoreductase [Streptomyces sp. NPDC005181]|uniref:SDR family NAD(P)-dependent oxidoreductase n=1 Tax=Streptomyces sp. NPDC005181 TaxID=3156869 RepID=UPI0033AB6B6F